MHAFRRSPPLPLLAITLALSALPVMAQYKIVAPDGRVTYTDRPPADGSLKVTALGKSEVAPADTGPALPLALRQLAERFPVTFFSGADCPPCDSGRDYLRQRGIPYRERQVISNDDAAALERLVAGRTLPALTVGGQALRGYSAADWASYLDAAGYPRESALPAGWTAAAPTPLVARAPVPARTTPATNAEATPAPVPAPATGTTIRF